MKDVKAIIMDVDGTLTDGSINISETGEIFKGFYCRDGLAIIQARERGIIPVILTSRSSAIVLKRAEELGVTNVIQGAGNNKKKLLEEFLAENNISYEELAYIGDDINDLECMSLCGIVGCPNDAVKKVKIIADYICDKGGGKGAVREFIDWLLDTE